MKKILLFMTIVLIMSCERYDNTCNCENPIEDLTWLKDLKSSFTNCTCRMSIFQATYNKNTVFYAIMNDELCNSSYPIVIRDCNGDTLKTYKPSLGEPFKSEVTDHTSLYTCKTEF